MCLIVFSFNYHRRYRLVIAANRDEYYSRPTRAAAFWHDYPGVLAGQDLQEKGTWLGITRTGRFAAITNYRDSLGYRDTARSRGELVSGYLQTATPPRRYLEIIDNKSSAYNGFNLLVGNMNECYYYDNRRRRIISLNPGLYGISNHYLDTPWPKVEKAKSALRRCLKQDLIEPASLLSILADRTQAPDKDLPKTGVDREWERALSAIFIKTPGYGTRSSTIILVDHNNNVTFVERTFNGSAESYRDVKYEFKIEEAR